LKPEALAAYRRMAAARKPRLIPTNSDLFVIFSGYRDPDADAARCAKENNCESGARAICSAHRTGLALDINLGAAPGSRVDSSDDANWLYLSRTKLYRWMVKKGRQFGFVNYPFEPWHWEFVASSVPHKS
jgi:D-alanyl-D-alanine carboxypeptidase